MQLVSEEIVDGRTRRSYGLTQDGADAVVAEANRMAEAASLVINAARHVTTKTARVRLTVKPA